MSEQRYDVTVPVPDYLASWPVGSFDAMVGRWAWLGARSPFPTGRCTTARYLPDGTVVLTFAPDAG